MEPLADPVKDRVLKTVRPPPHRPLNRTLMFPEKLRSIFKIPYLKKLLIQADLPDWKVVRDHLSKEGRIRKEEVLKLIIDVNKILSISLGC
jgi:serine/threonine-protein phosphatase 2B catalytic subunit